MSGAILAGHPQRRTVSSLAATLWIMAAAVLAMSALGAGLVWGAVGIDNVAARREEQLVSNGLKLKDAALRDCITPQVMWDDAVRSLDSSYSAAWAATNIGQYLTTTCGAREVYVIDGAGAVLGGWRDGKAVAPELPAALRNAVADLTRTVRARESRRGRFPVRPPQPEMIASPIDETNVVATPAGPVVMSASLVQPDFGAVLPAGARAPLVITVQPIDAGYRKWLSDYFLIRLPASEAAPLGPADPRLASAVLNDRRGAPVVRFTWPYDHPARDLIRVVAPAIAVLIPVLAATPVATIWRDRRQARRLREAMVAASAASEAKSRFIANISHEIRTPMNGIMGILHILRGKALDADSLALINQAISSSGLLQGLLNDVLDLSRIEEGRLELECGPVDLVEILQEVTRLFEAEAAEKGISIRASHPERGAVIVMADGLRLRQVLMNIVANAVKFSRDAPVEVSLRIADADPEGRRRVRFEVTDQGVGIPPEIQPSIFGRFIQADASVSRRYGGSGLGLSVCKALVDLMEGAIGFSSREGEGSTFWFEFDAAECVTTAPAHDREAEGAVGDVRVLVVEDNPVNRLVVSRILEAYGVKVETACDGAEGVAAAQAGAFDLILMDVQMPVMDGVTATRAIRALEAPAGRVPIIGLTANVLPSQKRTYREAGMNDVVDKPIDPPAVIEAIAAALDGQAA